MPRSPSRLLLPIIALVALILLLPSLASAFPQDITLRSAEHSAAVPGLFSRIWDLLSAVWMNGSALEPDGANASPSTEPDAATGDNGPGLDPNG